MQYLREATSSQTISIGPFLDSTDQDTEENGLSISNTDILFRKAGTTTLVNMSSGGATIISNGVYSSTISSTDSSTRGRLELYVHMAGAMYVKQVYTVLPAETYDAMFTDGLNNLSTAEVNAEVVDVLNVDTFAELAAVPAATSSIIDKLTWLFMLARNKITQTSTLQTITDDAGTTNVATSVVSDNGTTTTRNEFT